MKKLFLLPGLMCNDKLWQNLKLDNCETINIPQKDSIDEMTEELHGIFKNLEKPINLIGFSLGGYLTLNYTLTYPNDVNKALIISSGVNSLGKKELEKRVKMLKLLEKNSINSLSFMTISSILEDKMNESNIDIIKEMFSDLGLEVYKQQLSATLKRESLFDKLKNSKIKTMFLSATKDSLVNIKSLEELCSINDNFNLKTINSSSHMLPLEYEEFLKYNIEDFFNLQ